jgi:tetratricopeptide (TPR) repeat protein/O-antigen ligase
MGSKLSRYCEGLIEAAWLAAVIVIPLFFNVVSSRIFEPDKISILRTLALVILAAWIVKIVDQGRTQWKDVPRQGSTLRTIFRIPILFPVLLLVVVYVISSVLSIVPRTSFLGSYQRLQGTYTAFSYIVIFAALVGNMRRRDQVDRLITTIVLSSLPVALYGVLQRYGLDPVPWGGDVQNRIAANMGNSIFAAAYLIMIFPLAVGKVITVFRKILVDEGRLVSNVVRGTIYIFILILDLIAIYLSGSRGPFLGLLAGMFFLFVLLALHWNKRWLLLTSIGLALAAGVFLLVLNIPNGPLESVRDSAWVGRLGHMLDMDQRTSRVRTLIWQGAAELVAPHEPLQYPTGGEDRLNVIRPLIGYGPESMYVAYNRFYPPELAQVEKRNASPDRSHNETWDSLVTTGVIGFLIYQAVFISIFYFGLKWVGLINTRRQRNFFLALVIAFGIIAGVGFVAWQGWGFLGIGLPFGMILGLITYLTGAALAGSYQKSDSKFHEERALAMIMLLAAIVGHFVEIHFGIAIAATRTLFWTYTGALVVLGYIVPFTFEYSLQENIGSDTIEDQNSSMESNRIKRNRSRKMDQPSVSGTRSVWRGVLIPAGIVSIILVTLSFDYIANMSRSTSAIQILVESFTTLPTQNFAASYGILLLLLITWLFASAVLAFEFDLKLGDIEVLKRFGISLLVSGIIIAGFWFIRANLLASLFRTDVQTTADVLDQIRRYGNLLAFYYIYLLLILFFVARFLPAIWPAKPVFQSAASLVTAAVLSIGVLFLGYTSNLRVNQADISFKLADPFTKTNQWPGAILVYQQAIQQAPQEDHYYLFLGRAYLEYARTLQDANERQSVMNQAVNDLQRAQKLNPLDTDHTANLARIYSFWSTFAQSDQEKQAYLDKSLEYYDQALNLSPNNAGLWTELAILDMNALNQPEQAFQAAQKAGDLDPTFDRVHAILGDYYVQKADSATTENEKSGFYQQAAEQYSQATQLIANSPANYPTLYSYQLALGSVYLAINKVKEALGAYEQAFAYADNDNRWRVAESIARLYMQLGDKSSASAWGQRAQQIIPDSESVNLDQLLKQIQTMP